jgi:two-component system osmolarity sensor histidine kinase EnvZ
MADDVELGRVLQNLFENARRYGRTNDTDISRVSGTYARTGPWAVINVRDHGQGVDPAKLKQLTTPFFRGRRCPNGRHRRRFGLGECGKSGAAHGRPV